MIASQQASASRLLTGVANLATENNQERRFEEMAKSVTGHDVAKLAGVSQATVSRALRNLPGISPEARAAVLRAAADLTYTPSDSGRALSTRSTQRVALVVEELTNPYYPELVHPIQRHLAAAGLRTVLVTDTGGEASERPAIVEDLADKSYDGIILTTTLRHSSLPRALTERGIPHVLINRIFDEPESHCCSVDNAAGMSEVSRLLAELGHRRIAAIHGPSSTSTGRERAESLRAGLGTHGIVLHDRLVKWTQYGHDPGMAAALVLLDESPRPTAIVCGNDVIALGVLSAARKRNIQVPKDLTVIGFDDISMAAWPLVDLTTVRCDLEQMARIGVELLVAEIENPGSSPIERRVEARLCLRSTHAAPS